MLLSGQTAQVMVAGRYGAFQGLNGQAACTAALNNDGYSVTDWQENDPSIISQVLEGDFLSRPYQVQVTVTLGNNYNSLAEIANEVGADFGQALGTLPTAVAVTQVDGVSTGQVQNTASYGFSQVTGGIADALKPLLSGAETILIVAIVGILLVIVFAPKSVRALV